MNKPNNRYDALTLALELAITAKTDFYSASLALEDFINSANEESGYNVLVWFDEATT